jgi:hypothetical protein
VNYTWRNEGSVNPPVLLALSGLPSSQALLTRDIPEEREDYVNPEVSGKAHFKEYSERWKEDREDEFRDVAEGERHFDFWVRFWDLRVFGNGFWDLGVFQRQLWVF